MCRPDTLPLLTAIVWFDIWRFRCDRKIVSLSIQSVLMQDISTSLLTKSSESFPPNIAPILIAVAQLWRQAIAQELSDDGLSDVMALPLVHLLRDGDGIRQTDLVAHVGVESTALVRILDQLERSGQIERKPHPEDRRAKLVFLTAPGQELARHAEAIVGDLRQRLLQDVDPSDIKATNRLLRAVKAASMAREANRD